MNKRLITLALLPLCAYGAAAQDLQRVNAEAIRNSVDIQVPQARPAAAAPSSARFYLEQNSYDPLLMRGRRSGEKINIIGGTIDIPGIDSSLDFARKYRQAEYRRHDLQSDVALTVYTKNLPKVLFQVLFGIAEDNGNPGAGTYNDMNPVVEDPAVPLPTEAEILALDVPEDEKERLLVQLRNSKMHIEGRINPFRKKEMIEMYKQIIAEERVNGLEPKFGLPHEWSPEFRAYCREKGEMIPLTFTKLLTALASGTTARFFKTGTEAALIEHILSREDASVTMDQLFRASYRLNYGDVYLAILTIENILGDNWRHPERDKLAVTRKLTNICNFYQGRGDKYGAWYHFHGIMLYGYVRGGLRAALIGGIETAGSHVLGGPNDQNEQQEDYVNSVGGKIGARLAKVLAEKLYEGFAPSKNYCDPNVYLDLSEDFRDRLEYVESTEFKAQLDDARIWLKALDRDYLDCHVEIIGNDYTGQLNSKFIAKRDHVNFKKGKQVPLLVRFGGELTKARAFITGCLADQGVVSNKAFGAGQAPMRVWVDSSR